MVFGRKKEDKGTVHIPEAGKGNLDDELLPNRGRPVRQKEAGGDESDTAGRHGDMAVETASGLEEKKGG